LDMNGEPLDQFSSVSAGPSCSNARPNSPSPEVEHNLQGQ
jgi:hypothetical protein